MRRREPLGRVDQPEVVLAASRTAEEMTFHARVHLTRFCTSEQRVDILVLLPEHGLAAWIVRRRCQLNIRVPLVSHRVAEMG